MENHLSNQNNIEEIASRAIAEIKPKSLNLVDAITSFEYTAREHVIEIASAYYKATHGISIEEALAIGKTDVLETIRAVFTESMYEKVSSLECLDQFSGTSLAATATGLREDQVHEAGRKYAEVLMKSCVGLLDELE